MPVKLAKHQLEFWQELLAPFEPNQLSTTKRGGKDFTYIDKRSISNRLDSVCGPHGWYPEYEATPRGYKCRLFISVPMETPGTYVMMAKEDGAGFEEMGATNKQTGEFEYDVDNDEKSGYTNAFRRAAQDAWGIGRYLYQKGIPTFLNPKAQPLSSAPLPPIETPLGAVGPAAPPKSLADAQSAPPSTRDMPRDNPPQAAAPPAEALPAKAYDNFKIPRAGKQVFAWTKEMEKAFETSLVNGIKGEAEKQGWGTTFTAWTQAQVDELAMGLIRFCRELPTYKGQYEYLFQANGAPPPKVNPTVAPGVNLADLRKDLLTKITALLNKQLGRAPTNVELKAAFQSIGVESPNSGGNTGEQPESLASLTDEVWVRNMIALAERQIVAASQPGVINQDGEGEIPF